MKKLMDVLIVLCLFCAAVFGQNVNPQTNFVAQEQLANPSLLLNFNDATASFKDQVSQLSFTGVVAPPTYVAGAIVTPLSTNPATQIQFSSAPLPGGQLQSISIQYASAPASGQTCTFLIGTVSGSSVTIAHSFSVTVASTTAVQTFVVGTNFPTTSVLAGQLIGFWAASGMEPAQGGSNVLRHYYAPGSSTTPSGTYTFTAYSNPPAISAVVQVGTSGVVSPRQQGFDNTDPSNTSAGFGWNTYSTAPNSTLGSIDWMNPWTMLLHIDRLNWNRTGTLVLASKGDSSSTANNWWKLYLNGPGNGPGIASLCFTRNGVNGSGASFAYAQNQICTSLDAMTNGYNYDLVVTDSGAGTGAALDLYINGLDKNYIPETATTNSYQYGFGAVNLTISGGTGYASSTAFTSTGGGPNCTVSGTIPATGGVPTSGLLSSVHYNNYNAGCTSLPTINLTSPTGTGMVITMTLAGASMNSTTLPLMVPGYVSAGAYNGIDQSDSTQTSTNVDEFAIFPGVISATNIQSLYYLTKFYQGILGTPQHVPMLLAESSCGDYDSTTTVSVAAALHRLGYIKLLGLDVEYDNGEGAATWRQVLDQSGLNDIPIGMPSNASTIGPGGGWCLPANITAYNASTPQLYTGYESSSTLFRTIFAANPTTAIQLNNPTQVYGIYDFMNSAADSISPKTGAQLWLQNVTNGGSMYLEGGPTCGGAGPLLPTLPATTPCTTSVTGDNLLTQPTQSQYVLNNLQGMPLYLMGGSPAPNGPGVLVTRPSKDPLYLASAYLGTDGRTAWDSLGTMMMLSSLFQGGVQIGYSGGTGYANATAFTSTGGGPNCSVTGYMTASGGVPNGIKTSWGGYSTRSSWSTYGHGCTSAPTIVLTAPTGTGVTLTAYPSTVCGTDVITQPGGVWTDSFTSSTCSNQYSVIPTWEAAAASSGGGAPIYQWLLNSLENPFPSGQPRAQ